jgi:hypothetical protein
MTSAAKKNTSRRSRTTTSSGRGDGEIGKNSKLLHAVGGGSSGSSGSSGSGSAPQTGGAPGSIASSPLIPPITLK